MTNQTLTTLHKLQKIAEQLNNRIDNNYSNSGTNNNKTNTNNKLKFNFTQEHYYLAYDFNTRSITQLMDRSAFKVQGVVYCLDSKFKETALRWITAEELEGYLKDD